MTNTTANNLPTYYTDENGDTYFMTPMDMFDGYQNVHADINETFVEALEAGVPMEDLIA